jgi:F-type H+-transporting ATPase subunit b
MEERKNKIAGDLLQAQNEKTRAQELAAAGKQKLQETIKHADQIITESRAEAQAEKQTILTAAENRAVKAIDRAKEKIKSEENRARQELKASVATLVAEAGGKLIGKSLSEKEHLKLIEKSLAELETHL